ncbi:MAG: response regulator, partial [Nitrospinota bacterium]
MIRILHVDDEEIFHILTRENLCQVDPDLQFVWLPSAQEALEILKTRHIDCILSDFQMPGMDGLEFLRAVRSANCQIPFILHTGQGNEKVAVEAFQYGADDYFTKDAGFAHYERMVNSIKKQITNFKEASKRRQAESAIVASEAKYKELVENTSTILLRHKDGKVTFFNEFAQKFFGYDASEILGKSLVGTIFPETDSLGKDLRGLLKNPTINPEEYEENENIKRDGERVWVAWRNKVVNNPDTGEKEIFSIGMDISERRNAEHKLHL